LEFGEMNNYEHEHPGSEHPGGAHFGLADGSVRFIGEHINSTTLKALATVAGSEVVKEAF
jgi:prepilin-type processing-associated H-X9-DG protein